MPRTIVISSGFSDPALSRFHTDPVRYVAEPMKQLGEVYVAEGPMLPDRHARLGINGFVNREPRDDTVIVFALMPLVKVGEELVFKTTGEDVTLADFFHAIIPADGFLVLFIDGCAIEKPLGENPPFVPTRLRQEDAVAQIFRKLPEFRSLSFISALGDYHQQSTFRDEDRGAMTRLAIQGLLGGAVASHMVPVEREVLAAPESGSKRTEKVTVHERQTNDYISPNDLLRWMVDRLRTETGNRVMVNLYSAPQAVQPYWSRVLVRGRRSP